MSVLGAALYGALVFAGAAILGFVVAPWLAVATGLMPIDVEARGLFSMITLKGMPFLLGLSAASAVVPGPSRRGALARAALYVANVVLAWLAAAAIALARLG